MDYTVYVNAGYKALVNMIASKLDSLDNAERYHFLEDVYEDYFVYRVERRNAPSEFFKRSYEYNESNQTLEFGSDPEQVRKVIDYQTVNTDTGGKDQVSKECKCSEEKVNTLIEASDVFTSEDKESLMKGFTEEQVDKMIANANADKGGEDVDTNKDKGKDKEPTTDEKIDAAVEKAIANMDPEQLMKKLPGETQEFMAIGLEAHKEEHTRLVNELKESQSEFSEEELSKFKVPQLKRLANAIGTAKPATNDFSFMGAGALGNIQNGSGAEEILPIPIANKKKEDK